MGYGRYGGAADARFIVMMIPHHEGAIAMAELALRRARRREIKALAQRIKASQGAEIVQMSQWYQKSIVNLRMGGSACREKKRHSGLLLLPYWLGRALTNTGSHKIVPLDSCSM